MCVCVCVCACVYACESSKFVVMELLNTYVRACIYVLCDIRAYVISLFATSRSTQTTVPYSTKHSVHMQSGWTRRRVLLT